jgi:hypothetical protein
MPADLPSILLLVLLNAAETVQELLPYVVSGVVVAALLSRLGGEWRGELPKGLPQPLAAFVAAVAGVASPLPTMSTVPSVLQLRESGLPAGAALAFALASSLMNPQLFILTLGALGPEFALAQLVCVLLLSVGLGLVLCGRLRPEHEGVLSEVGGPKVTFWVQLVRIAEHVGLYFLVGVVVGASVQVLLPQLGVLDWLGERGWLSTPLLGWLGAPFYTCAGSAIPLASSLLRAGIGHGTLFSFLLIGPALRGTTLAALGFLMPKRTQVVCLAAVVSLGGLLGYGFEWLAGVV